MAKLTLRTCFRPEVENGALFIPTERPYGVGDEVFMPLWLEDRSDTGDVGFDVKVAPGSDGKRVRTDDPIPVAGKIIACGLIGPDLEQGIVVQFLAMDSGNTLCRIVRLLSTGPESS